MYNSLNSHRCINHPVQSKRIFVLFIALHWSGKLKMLFMTHFIEPDFVKKNKLVQIYFSECYPMDAACTLTIAQSNRPLWSWLPWRVAKKSNKTYTLTLSNGKATYTKTFSPADYALIRHALKSNPDLKTYTKSHKTSIQPGFRQETKENVERISFCWCVSSFAIKKKFDDTAIRWNNSTQAIFSETLF